MSGIGIITNPHSKLNKRNPDRPALLGYILGEQGRLEITESLTDLSKAAAHFKSSGIEILAINGGDGTISQTITAFIQAYGDSKLPRIALLRGGTMNVVAQSLGMRGSPERLLYRLVDGYSSAISWQTKELVTLRINDHFGFLYADGIATSLLSEFYKKKSNAIGAICLGLRVYLANIFNTKLSQRLLREVKTQLSFEMMKTELNEMSLGVFAASIQKLPLGLNLFPEAQKSTDIFQFFTLRSKARCLFWELPGLLLKTRIQSNSKKFSDICNKLTIRREEPFSYTLDGELYSADKGELKIELGPTLEFIVF